MRVFTLIVGSIVAAVLAAMVARASATGERGELERLVDELARADLPADLVVNKVLEGTAKGVERARIVAAARGIASEIQLVARVVYRHELAPRADRRVLVRAGVSAHIAGVPLPDVDRIVAAGVREGGAPAVAALYAAADLRGQGYPTDATVDLVVGLSGRDRYSDELGRVLAVTEAARHRTGLDRRVVVERLAAAVARGADLAAAARTLTGS